MKIPGLCLALAVLWPASLVAGSIRTEMVTEWKSEIGAGKAQAAAQKAPPGKAPGREAPGSLDDIIEGLFQCYPATHVLVDGKLDIYISDEGIYAVLRKPVGPQSGKDDAPVDNWNFVVTADGVFEWQTGQKDGLKIARNDREILGYLLYILGASLFEGSLYEAYLQAPDTFQVVPGKGGKWKELRLKNPVDGFEAVYVTEKPLWFYGLRIKTPKTGSVERLISAPESIEKVPDDVKAQFEAIHFENSALSLARHMVWP